MLQSKIKCSCGQENYPSEKCSNCGEEFKFETNTSIKDMTLQQLKDKLKYYLNADHDCKGGSPDSCRGCEEIEKIKEQIESQKEVEKQIATDIDSDYKNNLM